MLSLFIPFFIDRMTRLSKPRQEVGSKVIYILYYTLLYSTQTHSTLLFPSPLYSTLFDSILFDSITLVYYCTALH